MKLGTIQRRWAWPLREDDKHKSRLVNMEGAMTRRALYICIRTRVDIYILYTCVYIYTHMCIYSMYIYNNDNNDDNNANDNNDNTSLSLSLSISIYIYIYIWPGTQRESGANTIGESRRPSLPEAVLSSNCNWVCKPRVENNLAYANPTATDPWILQRGTAFVRGNASFMFLCFCSSHEMAQVLPLTQCLTNELYQDLKGARSYIHGKSSFLILPEPKRCTSSMPNLPTKIIPAKICWFIISG